VKGDDAAIACQMDINFDGIGVLAPSQLDGTKRILRSLSRSPAMPYDFQWHKMNSR
jgi:hypothetical protein